MLLRSTFSLNMSAHGIDHWQDFDAAHAAYASEFARFADVHHYVTVVHPPTTVAHVRTRRLLCCSKVGPAVTCDRCIVARCLRQSDLYTSEVDVQFLRNGESVSRHQRVGDFIAQYIGASTWTVWTAPWLPLSVCVACRRAAVPSSPSERIASLGRLFIASGATCCDLTHHALVVALPCRLTLLLPRCFVAVRVILGLGVTSFGAGSKHVWYVITNSDAAYDLLKRSEELRQEACIDDVDSGWPTRSAVRLRLRASPQ
jgi:hypothetical protein